MPKLPRDIAASTKSSKRGRQRSRSDESSTEDDEIIIELEPLPPEKKAMSQDELFRAAGVVILPIPHSLQKQSSWCYAACARMILRAYKINDSQCQIVAGVKKRKCCDDPIPRPCVDTGADAIDITPIYTSRGITAARLQNILAPDVLQDTLREHKPVEITRQHREQPDSFHAVVIKGFKDDHILVHDPLRSPMMGPYSYLIMYPKLKAGKHYTWHNTWRRFPEIT
jgi:Papain-like cysteine protease AvrRpt2